MPPVTILLIILLSISILLILLLFIRLFKILGDIGSIVQQIEKDTLPLVNQKLKQMDFTPYIFLTKTTATFNTIAKTVTEIAKIVSMFKSRRNR